MSMHSTERMKILYLLACASLLALIALSLGWGLWLRPALSPAFA